MRDLEIAGIIVAGVCIGLVLENNKSALKNIIRNITTPTPTPSEIHPIAGRAPIPSTIPRRVCPPGMYPDTTLGIYHCHDPGETRPLAPVNVTTRWEAGFGDDYDFAAPPLIPPTTASTTLPPPKPEPQALTEAQKKRQQQKKKKHREEVHAQVECPDDLSKMKCGSDCYKNGKLWKIVC